VRVARDVSTGGARERVSLDPKTRQQLLDVRTYIQNNWLTSDSTPIYGFNTGVGRLKNWRVPLARMREFQQLLINAHAAGTGDPFPEDVVRAVLLLRLNANARGHSGVRVELLDRLIEMLNAGIHPVIPRQGSVGASGDLAPLAYVAAVLMGQPQAQVIRTGGAVSAESAFREASVEPTFELEAKEALALVNGSTVSLAVAVLASHDANTCSETGDVALALSMEAMRCELAAFDERLHAARPHLGQVTTARRVRRLLAGSERCSTLGRSITLDDEIRVGTLTQRVQDAYSIRCAPQVHGPVRDALEYVRTILTVELNSATDNPLIFADSDGIGFHVLSGGNFHGQYLAQATDILSIALTDLGSISERRAARLLDPTMSYGLPFNLVGKEPGLNTGFSIAQCTMAALTTENKSLCWPASVDSIPTKSNQEDHVSNSTWCARKATLIVDNVCVIIAIELLLAAQAISITESQLGGLRLGDGTKAAYDLIRREIPAALGADRWLHDDIMTLARLVREGTIASVALEALPEER